MEYDTILNRNKIKKDILAHIETNIIKTIKNGIYIYGNSGCGKTTFILNMLKPIYDVVLYNACDIRNKATIEGIIKDNINHTSVLNLLNRKSKKTIIVIDEIDSIINSNDKGCLSVFIKLLRIKKSKKKSSENKLMTPILFIGNYNNDKKINELMKICCNIELSTPTHAEIKTILLQSIPPDIQPAIVESAVAYIDGDLKKINMLRDILTTHPTDDLSAILTDTLQSKKNNDNIKKITKLLFQSPQPIENHNMIMNETDRTIIGLLWHENIVDILDQTPDKFTTYIEMLKNISFSDYIDRITFQKQIWTFNEMTSLIKTFKNNKIYHCATAATTTPTPIAPETIRFTKILTKYSTQYNNECFIQYLCQQLMIDKKDMFQFFTEMKEKYDGVATPELLNLFENSEITKLDINRIFRYIDKSCKEVEEENYKEVETIEEDVADDV